MDGVHDLGGREGFGLIQDKEDGRPFHAEWEMRAFGMEQSSAGGNDWTIDWFRHCRELIAPADYLSRCYFDHWLLTLAAQMIDAGYVTMDEIKSGVAVFVPDPGYPPSTVEESLDYVKYPKSYAMDVVSAPLFSIGENVRCSMATSSGHTRLPGYARGRSGTIFAHHGGHVLPDASARGEEKAEHLYTVSFTASELWTETMARPDSVFIDLWESYLEPA